MIPKSSLEGIDYYCRDKYGETERIVGIMLARYSLGSVKDIIRENYNYWHERSGKDFDVFWLGYEKSEEQLDSGDGYWVKVEGLPSVYYSDALFSEGIKQLEREESIEYTDVGCTLLLLNYNGHEIDYSENVTNNLVTLNRDEVLREFVEYAINYSPDVQTINQLRKIIPKRVLVPKRDYSSIISFFLTIIQCVEKIIVWSTSR